VNAQIGEENQGGRKFGKVTLRRIDACPSSALSSAVKAQRINRNPAAFVPLPEVSAQGNPLSPAELGTFLDHISPIGSRRCPR
jgi:hypothetical protein